jgi:hypothetical protein
MSGKIMGQVWDLHLPTNEQLVLLAMADHADHLGQNIWPSVGLIAWKTGYSERTIQRVIKSLLEKEILKVQKIRPGKTTIYCTALENAPLKPKYGDKPTPDIDVTPDTKDVTPTPDTQMSPEPSYEPSLKIKDSTAPTGAVQSNAETEGDEDGTYQSDWNAYIIATMVEWVNTPFYHDPEKADAYLDDLFKQKKISGYDHADDILAIVKFELITPPDEPKPTEAKPKKERQPNPWYDAVAVVFDLHGGRNGLMVGLLQGTATKNGHKDYNLPQPLTSADDILKFGRWWKANHEGLTMVQSPVKVQSEVMGWQAKGCPDAPGQSQSIRREGIPAYVPPGGYVIG